MHGLLATGFRIPCKGVLLSLGPVTEKYWFTDETRVIVEELKLPIFATGGTSQMLTDLGFENTRVSKNTSGDLSALTVIDRGDVDLVINVPIEYDEMGRPDGYLIRRRAIDRGIPLITDLQLARAVVEALRWKNPQDLNVRSWDDFLARDTRLLV